MSAEEWNERHPIGTPVVYWPVYPPEPGIGPVETKTRSEAWPLGHGEVVVKVEGRAGGVALSHIELLVEKAGSK